MKSLMQSDQGNFTLLQEIWTNFLGYLPKILLGIGLIVLAWLILKLVLFALKKILKATKIDNLSDKLNEAEIFGSSEIKFSLSKMILVVVKYLILLTFVVIGSELLELEILSNVIGDLISYLPDLLSALLIFILGVYIASLVRKTIISAFKSLEITGSKLVSNIVFYLIVIIISITALNQAGINTDIITNNLTMILGAVFISFTIAFGLGSREVVLRILFGFYSRKNFTIGQRIRTKNMEGVIEKIDNLTVTIRSEKGLFLIPIKKFVDQKVEVLNE